MEQVGRFVYWCLQKVLRQKRLRQRVLILVGAEELIPKIQNATGLGFDVVVATPDMMSCRWTFEDEY